MLKKNTLNNSRSTRSSNSTNGATVLKPIFPAAAATTSASGTQYKKIQSANLKDSSSDNSAFLLPSSEFFVVDKDSLVLSESDIFQTNLARRTNSNNNSSTSVSDNNTNVKNTNTNTHVSTIAGVNASNYLNISSPENDILIDEDDDEGNFDFDKENHNGKQRHNNNTTTNSIYADLLHSLPPANYAKGKKIPVAQQVKPTIAPMKSTNTPVPNSHVPTSQGEKAAPLDKGLRHFSAKVCAKVEEKGVTTYNEVADDLVQEIGLEMGKCDHKNIRRRVYDALNVLMAIDIICKEKKEIRWLGLPNEAADDLRALEAERVSLQERIAEKNRNLREILRRCISLKNLIDRNAADQQHQQGDKLPLPFILISAARDCHVHCEMLEDRTQYFFEFNTAFQINEDIELMRLMGLDTGRIERIKSFFPKELVAQVLMLCLNNNNSNTNSSNINGNNVNSQSLLDATAVNSTVFAPIINNEDLNLGDLESFNPSSSLSLPSSTLSSSL